MAMSRPSPGHHTRLPIVAYSYISSERPYGCMSLRANSQCNIDLILITNCSRAGIPEATIHAPKTVESISCYDWGRSAERSGAAAVLDRHPGPPLGGNAKVFEMASIVRWLFLAQLMSDLQLDAVSFVDCDVRVYSDIAALYASHPLMPLADLAITGHNGAISVWRRAALQAFAAFLKELVAACDLRTLQYKYSVDMRIIGTWQRVQTDMDITNLKMTPEISSSKVAGEHRICNHSFPVRRPRFRMLNMDLMLGTRGWRQQPHWSLPAAWRFGAGNVGVACPLPPPRGKGCPAWPASKINCSDADLHEFIPTMTPLAHPQKGPQLVKEMYSVPARPGIHNENPLCTPFVRDGCGRFAPFHIAHYTGRHKHYFGIGQRAGGSSCACVRTWSNWATVASTGRLVSHPQPMSPQPPKPSLHVRSSPKSSPDKQHEEGGKTGRTKTQQDVAAKAGPKEFPRGAAHNQSSWPGGWLGAVAAAVRGKINPF